MFCFKSRVQIGWLLTLQYNIVNSTLDGFSVLQNSNYKNSLHALSILDVEIRDPKFFLDSLNPDRNCDKMALFRI